MLSVNRLTQCGAVIATLFLANTASAVTIDSFQFNGILQVEAGSIVSPATVTFLPSFTIQAQNGLGAGELVGLNGNIAGGYTFDDPGGNNTVPLTSPGVPNGFTIDDGVNIFAADIDLIELQGGGGGSIVGAIDFSSSSYAGANAGLIALNDLIQNTPNLTVTFQTLTIGGVDLDELFVNGSGGVATFSAGVIVSSDPTAVPEPGPLALLGMGLLCSAAFACRRSSSRRSDA